MSQREQLLGQLDRLRRVSGRIFLLSLCNYALAALSLYGAITRDAPRWWLCLAGYAVNITAFSFALLQWADNRHFMRWALLELEEIERLQT